MTAICGHVLKRLAAPLLVAGLLVTTVGSLEAGVGDSRGTVDIPADAQCGGVSGTAAAMVAGGRVGFPRIPVLLVTSCQGQIFFLDPSTDPAKRIKTITTSVTPANGWGALALRSDKGDLLACTAVAGGTDIYSIDFSPFNTIADGTATKLRSAPATSTCAGIAWDPQSKTIYQSSTGSAVLHFQETGTGSLTPIPSGCSSGTAGIGIAGTSLFVGCQPSTALISSRGPDLAQASAAAISQDPRARGRRRS